MRAPLVHPYCSRTKGDPLWTTLLVGGVHNGESYLGFVDKIGTSYSENVIATGFGAHMAIVGMDVLLVSLLTHYAAIDANCL